MTTSQPGCIILASPPELLAHVAGVSVVERLLRTLSRCGVTEAILVTTKPQQLTERIEKKSWARPNVQVTCHHAEDTLRHVAATPAPLWLVIRGDTIFDPRMLELLLTENRAATLVDSAAPGQFCGAALLPREAISSLNEQLLEEPFLARLNIRCQPEYIPSLRRCLPLFWFTPSQNSELVERILVEATQKGAQDFPALLHAPLEKFLVRRLAPTRITPINLTISWIALGFVATFFFATDHLAWAVTLALVIGILDGIDGKLARLRVETSNVGKLEHHFDSLFEVGWPVGLAWNLWTSGRLPHGFFYLGIIIVGQIADGLAKRTIYGAFAALRREPDLFDRIVRLVGARRNVFVWIILIALLFRTPATSLIVMAWWQAATALADIPHALWLESLRRRRKAPAQAMALP